MLHEALTWLVTPCPAWARRLGYLNAAVAFEARARRCGTHWAEHRAACHDLIETAAARCTGRRRAVVLGSGLLVEVPLAALAQRFESVMLVDAVHLAPARRLAAAYPNVTLAYAELSGCALALAGRTVAGRGDLPTPVPPALVPPVTGPPALVPLEPAPPGEPFDFAVSANVLSQLPLQPLDALHKGSALDDDAVLEFARAIIRAHLAWLPRLARSVCLITDTVEVTTETAAGPRRTGGLDRPEVIEQVDALYGVRLPPGDRQWVWRLAPAPELGARVSQQNLMHGWFEAGHLADGGLR